MREWDETPRTDDEPTRRMPGAEPRGDASTQPLGATGSREDTQPQPVVEAPPQQPPYIPGSGDGGRQGTSEDRGVIEEWGGHGGSPRGRNPRGRNPFAIVAAVLAVALIAVVAFQVGSCSASGQTTPQPSTDAAAQPAPASPSAKSESPETDDSGDSAGDETLGALAGDALDKLGSIDVGEAKTQLSEGAKNLAGSAAALLDRFANS